MKNILLISSLALSITSFAAQGTLLLQGVVAPVMNITVAAEAGASNLDLTASPVDLKVATVTELTNSKKGYEVYISSANDGALNQENGDDSLAYTMKYGGVSVDFSSSSAVVDQATPDAYNVARDVQISYTGKPAEQMVEGTYTDTVTFTIQSKN